MLKRIASKIRFVAIGTLALLLCGCGSGAPKNQPPRAMTPDVYPAGTAVLFSSPFNPNTSRPLGPHSAKLFLDMLAQTPVHSEISSMPAAPMGTFKIGDNIYLWHGNGVINGSGKEERLWHGAFLQRLIQDVLKDGSNKEDTFTRILDAIETDPSVGSTPLEGPGAYPGGGDALHPLK